MPEIQQAWIRTLVLALDLGGTFVFALSGAAVGIRHKLDLFGVLVLSFVAAAAGGITRDLLIGAIPPAAILDLRYLGVSVLAGLGMFYSYPISGRPEVAERLRNPVLIFDAAGLALFAVAGAVKALAFRLGPVESILIGVLTGVGGGVVRDVLVLQVPTVLHSELYAVAAFAGASVVVVGRMLQFPSDATVVAGIGVCFGLRVIAIRRGWRLPTADARATGRADTTPAKRRSPDVDRGEGTA